MIHVIATIEVAPGRRGDFLEAFHRLVPLVLNEEGCIQYGPAIDTVTDISAQGPVRENVVVVVEQWKSLTALKAHLAAPHMAAYRNQVAEIVKSMTLQVLEPA
jgi:quinol monooxygenase YgiN